MKKMYLNIIYTKKNYTKFQTKIHYSFSVLIKNKLLRQKAIILLISQTEGKQQDSDQKQ